MHSPLTHFGAADCLIASAHQLPDVNAWIAALAALGLFCSGMSQLLKQVCDLWAHSQNRPPPPAARPRHRRETAGGSSCDRP